MANPLRYLNVQLRLLADDYNNKIKAAQKEAKEFEKTIRPSKELLGDIGKAATIAGTAILAGMAVAVKATADYADQINDAAQRTGVTTENLSKLKLAAEKSGSSFEGLTTGLKFLAKNMEAANAGGKEQIAAFKAAGISSRDLAAAHGDVNKIFLQLTDTFANAEDGAGKTALSMKLLGKSGSDLIPTMNDLGNGGFKKVGDEAERMGRIVSKEAGAAADQFNDQLTILEGSVAGLGGAIGTALIPPLTDLIKKTTDIVSGVQKWVAVHPDLTKGIAATATVLTGAGGLIVGATGLIALLPKLTQVWMLMAPAITLVNVALVGVLTAVILFRKEIAEVFLNVLSGALSGVQTFLNGVASLASKLGSEGLSAKLRDAADSAGIWAKAAEIGSAEIMKQGMVIAATAKQLEAEKSARDAAAAAAEKHRLQLEKDTEAYDKAKKAAEAYAEFWKKELQDFKNRTFDGGQEVRAGLDAAHDAVRVLVDDYKDLLKAEQEAGDQLIVNQQYWEKQLQIFRNGSESIKQDVKAGEEAADRTAKVIIENNEKIKKSGQDAIDSIANGISKIFLNKSAHKGFWDAFKSLGNAAVSSIADTFLKKMIHGFLDPFAVQFGKIIDKLAQKMAEVFTKSIPDAISGKTPPTFPTGKGSGVATASAIAGIAAPLVALAFAPQYGVNPMDIKALTKDWSKNYQQPFEAAVKTLLDSFNTLKQAGTLTLDQAEAYKESLIQVTDDYTTAAAIYSNKSNQAKFVIDDALDKLKSTWGPDIEAGIAQARMNPLSPAYDSFRASLKPADDFNAAMADITQAFSKNDIVKVYASQIIAAADAQRKHGYAVTGLVSELERAARIEANLSDAVLPRIAKSASTILGQFIGNISKLGAGMSDTLGTVVDDASALLQVLLYPPPAPKSEAEIFGDYVREFGGYVHLLMPSAATATAAPSMPMQTVYNIDITLNSNDPDDRRLIARMREWGRNNTRGFAQDIAAIARNNRQGVVTSAG